MCRKLLFLALAALVFATPVAAQSQLSLVDIARKFCAARLAGDMAPVTALLTPDLAALVAGHDASIWLGFGAKPVSCQPIGASGSYDHPEAILAQRLADGSTASDRLILSFVDAQLRIDDIAFADHTSLRTRLTAPSGE